LSLLVLAIKLYKRSCEESETKNKVEIEESDLEGGEEDEPKPIEDESK
jgi:hypothetical protein